MLRLQLVLAVTLCSCSTIRFRIPPVCIETPEAVIYAPSIADAERLAREFNDVAPRVRSILGDTRVKRAKVALVDKSLLDGPQGMNWGSWIFITNGCGDFERMFVAHELVHWYVSGVWTCLPGVMEEGLADRIATDLDPASAGAVARTRLKQLRDPVVTDPAVALKISRSEWDRAEDFDPHTTLASIGYFITMRVGVDRLRALCVRACESGHTIIPARWLLEEAGLRGSDVRHWPIRHKFGA